MKDARLRGTEPQTDFHVLATKAILQPMVLACRVLHVADSMRCRRASTKTKCRCSMNRMKTALRSESNEHDGLSVRRSAKTFHQSGCALASNNWCSGLDVVMRSIAYRSPSGFLL